MVKYTVRLPTGNEYGPADLATLRTWKAEGRIGSDALVWTEGAPDWLPLDAVLAAGTDPPRPQAAPPPPTAAAPPAKAPQPAPRREAGPQPAAPASAGAAPSPRGAAKAPAPTGSPAAGPAKAAGPTPSATPKPAARPAAAAGGGPAKASPAAAPGSPRAGAVPRAARPSRPRPSPSRTGRASPSARGGTGWIVAAGVAVVAVVGLAWAARSLLLPAVESWRAASRLQDEAAPESRFVDAAAGLALDPPGDWLLLKADSALLVAPLATARLAHATLDARATLTVRRQPPGLAPLDPYLDEVVGERRALVEGYAETARADAVLDGRPARRLSATWSEGGVAQEATAVATRDAWVYVALLAWGPASAGSDLDAAFEALASSLKVAGTLESRIAEQATGLLRRFPELSRPSVELLLRLRGEEPTDEARLAALMASSVGQGLSGLGPAETRELQQLYGRVYALLTDADRERLADWQQAVRAGQSVDPRETLAVRAAVRGALGRLPGEILVALQALNQKAIFAGTARS